MPLWNEDRSLSLFEISDQFLTDALVTFQEISTQLGIAHTLSEIGMLKQLQGLPAVSHQYLSKALVIYTQLNDPEGVQAVKERLADLGAGGTTSNG